MLFCVVPGRKPVLYGSIPLPGVDGNGRENGNQKECPINKGIGRPVEFKGLKAQYLFIFCGGLLALFVLFVILYMVGIDQWVCIGFGAASSSLLVWQTFALNARYGEHGLMKLGAARSHPRYLINRRRITRLFKRQRKEETT